MSSFKVIIIGGGLAGSLLANGLSQRSVDYIVYERDPKDSATRDGYQIRLGVSAMVGFRACLEPSQIKELMLKFGRSGGMILSAPILLDPNFNTLLDLTKFPAFTKSAPINRVVLRDFLAAPVYESGRLKYDKAFVRYEIREKGKPVRVFFADGTEDECDLLVAADGTSSKAGHTLCPGCRHALTQNADQRRDRTRQHRPEPQQMEFSGQGNVASRKAVGVGSGVPALAAVVYQRRHHLLLFGYVLNTPLS